MSKRLDYEVSSGNVFTDMGLPDAEELKAKSDLMIAIVRVIEERGLNQAEAAEIVVKPTPKSRKHSHISVSRARARQPAGSRKSPAKS